MTWYKFIISLILAIPFFILMAKVLDPLKPVRCIMGFHDFKFWENQKGKFMTVKIDNEGKTVLSFPNVELHRCCKCGKYKRVRK